MPPDADFPLILAPAQIVGFDGPDARTKPPSDVQPSPAIPELSPAQLLAQFESLGDNCEFGLVQRQAGAEPLGLFRFSFAKMSELLTVLHEGFRSLLHPEAVEIYLNRGEYMVRLNPYDFKYHTDQKADAADPEDLRVKEIRRVGFLVDKLIADLKDADKIFVRKGEGTGSLAEASALLAALRRYGDNTLLWAAPANPRNPPGTVEVVEPHLMRGHIGRFAPYDNAHDIRLGDWLDICSGAYRLHKRNAAVGTRWTSIARRGAVNLITDILSDGSWVPLPNSETMAAPPPPRPDEPVLIHVLKQPTDYRTGLVWAKIVERGLESEQIYTISAWITIPSNFGGTSVGVVFDGFPSLAEHKADLSIRDRWQQAWASARMRRGGRAQPGLLVVGNAGEFVYSTGWRLEAGAVPSAGP
jgi:hypothetical protein